MGLLPELPLRMAGIDNRWEEVRNYDPLIDSP
jgi:hypothetical protein